MNETGKDFINEYPESCLARIYGSMDEWMGGINMEKAFKTMTTAGASNIALGIIMVVTGIAAGVVTIVNGARLLKHRGEITF